LTAINHFILRN